MSNTYNFSGNAEMVLGELHDLMVQAIRSKNCIVEETTSTGKIAHATQLAELAKNSYDALRNFYDFASTPLPTFCENIEPCDGCADCK
jgi:hypothetical protein